ncbi:uncharacterized protein BKA55DRAFT_557021 [Fusarium redolens]|uniref:Uncharacterized protein n=1 Tax=Fusarium redolens TaxID=48865 RepID=A0A9P9HX37_FUSRE|nr:uncharacterized protein BKA55DRAFT_557021 [Fusarium redolens]KAH7264788.1 hypothetical protein BKA55DRAFT_557021 [Fusarium redolens]
MPCVQYIYGNLGNPDCRLHDRTNRKIIQSLTRLKSLINTHRILQYLTPKSQFSWLLIVIL